MYSDIFINIVTRYREFIVREGVGAKQKAQKRSAVRPRVARGARRVGVVTWEMFLAAWCSEEMVR